MKFEDLLALYQKKKQKYGEETYRHITELLIEAKKIHKKDFENGETAVRAKTEGRIPDHEQSWRAFKGKNLEKLVLHIIKDEIEILGLKIIEGNALERTASSNLPKELNLVKRALLVDYGSFGHHLPDVDLIIYDPNLCAPVAVISSKVTLRERIAQTGYWKIKLGSDEITKHIKVFFITPDEDSTLTKKSPAKKGRAIVEVDTDGGYVMSEQIIEESDRVKMFDKFIGDLKRIVNERNKQV